MAKKICTLVLAGLLAVTTTMLLLLPVFGYRFLNVRSPSMEPAFNMGDMIVVKPCKPEQVRIGDDITYYQSSIYLEQDVLITHRVQEILTERDGEQGLWFITQGLNHATIPDPPVEASQLVGKVALRLPWIGGLLERHAAIVLLPIALFAVLCYGCAALLTWLALRKRTSSPRQA